MRHPNMTIRATTASDFDQWKPLWDGYNAFYGRLGETALPADITRATWQRFHNPLVPMFCQVPSGYKLAS